MTDLCYNCGSCHLPRPCAKDLVTCEICHHMGHSWNFCHHGPHHVSPDYRYYALCHNCDSWHLPDPCKHDDVPCETCRSKGHLPFYCPIAPVRRQLAEGSVTAEETTGSKRQRLSMQSADQTPTFSQVAPLNAREALHVPTMADEVYRLRMDTVKEVLDLVTRFPPSNIFAHLAQSYLPTTVTVAQNQLGLPSQKASPPLRNVMLDNSRVLSASQNVSSIHNVGQFRLYQSGTPASNHMQAVQQPQTPVYRQQPHEQVYYNTEAKREEQLQLQQMYAGGALKHENGMDGMQYHHGPQVGRQENYRAGFTSNGGGIGLAASVEGVTHQMQQEPVRQVYGNEPVALPDMTQPGFATQPGGAKPGGKRGGKKATGTRAPRKTAAVRAKEKADAEAAQAQAQAQAAGHADSQTQSPAEYDSQVKDLPMAQSQAEQTESLAEAEGDHVHIQTAQPQQQPGGETADHSQ